MGIITRDKLIQLMYTNRNLTPANIKYFALVIIFQALVACNNPSVKQNYKSDIR